jgi:hypothetical protein
MILDKGVLFSFFFLFVDLICGFVLLILVIVCEKLISCTLIL